MSRRIDNLAEIAGAFGRMETARKMKQIVPECKSKKSGDEVMDGVGEGWWLERVERIWRFLDLAKFISVTIDEKNCHSSYA